MHNSAGRASAAKAGKFSAGKRSYDSCFYKSLPCFISPLVSLLQTMNRLTDGNVIKEFQELDIEVKLGSTVLDKRKLVSLYCALFGIIYSLY